MPGKLSAVDLAHLVAQRFPGAGIVVGSGWLPPDDIDLRLRALSKDEVGRCDRSAVMRTSGLVL